MYSFTNKKNINWLTLHIFVSLHSLALKDVSCTTPLYALWERYFVATTTVRRWIKLSYFNFFYTLQSYVLYTSLFLRQKKKREKIHSINWKKIKKKTQKKTAKKKGRMTHSNACQKHERAASKGVEDWLIYIYIYVCVTRYTRLWTFRRLLRY